MNKRCSLINIFKHTYFSFYGAAAAFLCTAFISCATTVPVTVTRPAQLDLNGAKTIAVLPFQCSSTGTSTLDNSSIFNVLNSLTVFFGGCDQYETSSAQYLTSQLSSSLSTSHYLSLVNADTVKAALESNQKAPVDVYLTGTFSNFIYNTVTSTESQKKDGKDISVNYYTRKVSTDVSYQIVDSATNKVISYKTTSLQEESAREENQSELESPYELIKGDLDGLAGKIMREIQPYQVALSLKLISSKQKNPDFDTANELAKSGLTAKSEEKFYSVYKTTGDFAAGYNAAKLLEAQGKYDEAKTLMNELVDSTGDKRAIEGLQSIQYEIDQNAKLQKQTEAQQAK